MSARLTLCSSSLRQLFLKFTILLQISSEIWAQSSGPRRSLAYHHAHFHLVFNGLLEQVTALQGAAEGGPPWSEVGHLVTQGKLVCSLNYGTFLRLLFKGIFLIFNYVSVWSQNQHLSGVLQCFGSGQRIQEVALLHAPVPGCPRYGGSGLPSGARDLLGSVRGSHSFAGDQHVSAVCDLVNC